MLLRRKKEGSQQRLGATIVETALVLPIFLMVLFAVVEFGRAFMVSQLLCNAAREGSHLAVMDGVTNTEVINSVKQQVADTVGTSLAEVTVNITITPYTGNPDPNNNLANASLRDMCAIEATVAYDDVSFIPVRFLSGVDLKGESRMRHE